MCIVCMRAGSDYVLRTEYVPDLRLSESELAPLFPLSHWLGMCVITGIATENEGREAGGADEVGTEVNVRTRMGFSSSLLPCSLQQHFTLSLIPRCCPSSVACQVARRLQPSLLCRRHPSSSMIWLVVACVSRYVPAWAPAPAVADVPLCSPIALD